MSAPSAAEFERLRGLAAVAADYPVATIPEVFTGRPLTTVPVGTAEDIAAAFTKARAAQTAWAARPVRERAAIIDRYRRLVSRRREFLMDIAQAETGKSRPSALEDVIALLLGARYYVEHGPKLLEPKRVPGLIPVVNKTVVRHLPKGVVGVISPWNYPMALSIGDAVPALLAGNAVVVKPDSQTPYCALALAELLYEAGMPRDLLAVVPGPGSVVGTALVNECDYLMFTGSAETGARLAEQCGRRLVGISAELGGKNPMIVTRTADLATAAKVATRAAFANSGQLCVSVERIYVDAAVAERFVELFVAETEAMCLGPGYDWAIAMGSLANPARVDAVEADVEDAREKGATVRTGGRRRPDLGPAFYEPTVLTGVTDEMSVAREETFGPVVSVYPVADAEEAIARANDSEYGLSASVFAGRTSEAEAIAARLRSGMVNIGEGYAAAAASLGAPFGGMGRSGLGRRHGPDGLLKYTEPQTIARQRGVTLDPLPGFTFARWHRALAPLVNALGLLPGR
ncbi:succinic semialdehyde dehydrogenase [Nocardia nova]|uniref:succinic semialdehyde dehydrogenase n=1 Tax=Nocardia nova TaxID=37330 RepID=UPI0033FAC2D6